MKKRLLLGALCSAIAMPTFAIDGYKDIKFGMSFEQLKRSRYCESYWYKELSGHSGHRVESTCLRFRIDNGTPYPINVYLANDKVYFIKLDLFKDLTEIEYFKTIETLIKTLEEKYGKNEAKNENGYTLFKKDNIYLSYIETNKKYTIYLSFVHSETIKLPNSINETFLEILN